MSVVDSNSGPGGLQSVDRALQVLELLASWGSGGVSELATEIGVHKSTAFRLLGALEARDLVEQTAERGKYRLGFGLVRLARRVNIHLEITEQARTLTENLAQKVGESINVAVLRENFAVNVVQSRGQASIASQNWIGQLTPLHATSSGKILLAYMAPEERRNMLATAGLARLTPHTITSQRALEEQIEAAARDGYASSVEELEEGLNAVAAPIRDHTGGVIAALSVSGPVYRFTEDRMREGTPDVVAAAASISQRMGHLD